VKPDVLILVVSRGGTNKIHAIFGVSTVVIILTMNTRFPRKSVDSTRLHITSKMPDVDYKIHVRRQDDDTAWPNLLSGSSQHSCASWNNLCRAQV